jgi:hypothetical protein
MTCGEVAKQDFSAILCVAKLFEIDRLRGIQRDFFGPPWGRTDLLAPPWGRTDFFGVDPKKVPLRLLLRMGPLLDRSPPHPRPLSRKGRGEKDLEESAGTQDSLARASAL